jgi:hypothetical protein
MGYRNQALSVEISRPLNEILYAGMLLLNLILFVDAEASHYKHCTVERHPEYAAYSLPIKTETEVS